MTSEWASRIQSLILAGEILFLTVLVLIYVRYLSRWRTRWREGTDPRRRWGVRSVIRVETREETDTWETE